GIVMSKEQGRVAFYGMSSADWKENFQTDTGPAKQAEFTAAFAQNVGDKS
ncbi:MAG: hypothetical protein ACI8YI_002215, partial [Paracoccaceae bacterium]